MGDVAVGARSGHEGPEEGREQLAESPEAVTEGVPGEVMGSENGTADADGPGGADGAGTTTHRGGSSRKRRQPKKQRSFWVELPLLVLIALGLALVIKTFFVQAFSIPSQSMQDTLQVGDRVLVDKLTPWFGAEPQRGEVVVFHDPGGWLEGEPTPQQNVLQKGLSFIGLMPSAEEKDLIKRVIAVGGDTVSCKKGGQVMVNGHALDEKSYLYPGNTPCDDLPFGPIKVPQGRIWVMGDHRQDSSDSRYHQNLPGNGTVSTKEVVGRAFMVAWPVNRWHILGVPDTFDQGGLSAAAAAGAPGALGLAGAVPLVVWRRRRLTRPRTSE